MSKNPFLDLGFPPEEAAAQHTPALRHPICYQDASLPHRRRYWPGTRTPEEFGSEELQRPAPAIHSRNLSARRFSNIV